MIVLGVVERHALVVHRLLYASELSLKPVQQVPILSDRLRRSFSLYEMKKTIWACNYDMFFHLLRPKLCGF